jgi:hypothetical protein
MIAEGVDRLRERGMMEKGSAARKGTAMPKTEVPDRPSVTSDPDRGVAVNSGTDPQRPGKPARAIPDAAAEKTPPREDSRPAPVGRNEDVEHGGRNEPDDPV